MGILSCIQKKAECFRYQDANVNCSEKCPNPDEIVKISDANVFFTDNTTEDDLKKLLFRAPATINIESWKHEMTLIGYMVTMSGFRWYDNNGIPHWLEDNSPYIGRTSWLVKNSWLGWGIGGFAHIIVDWDNDINSFVSLEGAIQSLQYNDEDINVKDEDGDGYYFWGIGERPASVPSWAPEEPDGDDSNADYGPIDQYGYLMDLNPETNAPIHVSTQESWNRQSIINNMVYIDNGGVLTITGVITMNKKAKIVVERGGKLIIDGGCINKADIFVSAGGELLVKRGGKIVRGEEDIFDSEAGALISIENGSIE